jgi:uncharacterized protein YfaP (DUF2135 family)
MSQARLPASLHRVLRSRDVQFTDRTQEWHDKDTSQQQEAKVIKMPSVAVDVISQRQVPRRAIKELRSAAVSNYQSTLVLVFPILLSRNVPRKP